MRNHHTHPTYPIQDKKTNAFDTSMASPARQHTTMVHDVGIQTGTPSEFQGSACICACRIATNCMTVSEISDYCHWCDDLELCSWSRRGSYWTQSNTQGLWPCKLPINSLPLPLLAKSPQLIFDLSNSLAEFFWVRLQGSQMKMLTVTFGMLKESEKVTTCHGVINDFVTNNSPAAYYLWPWHLACWKNLKKWPWLE